jgi:glucokinase
MLASALTDEHVTILKIINRLKTMQTLIVFEDVVSGRGLMNLYQAVCLYNGRKEREMTAKELIYNAASNSSDDIISDTLRLFHEFFGVFVHGVVISGNAYKGVFLDGGVYHALSSAGIFDFERFQEFFILNPVEPVKQDLQKTAILSVDTSYAALYGLKEMINNEL